MIDYLTLMLVALTAGLALAAVFFARALASPSAAQCTPSGTCCPHTNSFAAGFAAIGLVLLVTGLHMTLTWPLPKMAKANLTFANMAFGENAVLFGAILLGAALALARGWSLLPVSIFAFFAGIAAVIVGLAIAQLGLTARPELSSTGFILSGTGGILSPFVLLKPAKLLRYVEAVILLAAAGIWALTGYGAYWMHMASFSKVG